MILVLASLKLKTAFLSRDRTVNYIVEALAFVLRVPERMSFPLHLFIYWSEYVCNNRRKSIGGLSV